MVSKGLADSQGSLLVIYLVAFLDLLAVSLFWPILSRQIRDLGGSPFTVGAFGSIYGGIQLVSGPIVGRASDSLGRRSILAGTICLTAIAYLIQGGMATLTILLIARCLAGLFKHTQTLCEAFLAEVAPHRNSQVLGNVNAFGSMGYIIGPSLGGHLAANENGFAYASTLAAAIFILNAVLIFQLVPSKAPSDSQASDNRSKSAAFPTVISNRESLSQSLFLILMTKCLFSFSVQAIRTNLTFILDNKFQASVTSQGYLNSLTALAATLTGFTVGTFSTFYDKQDAKMVIHCGIIQTMSLVGLYLSSTFSSAGICLAILSAVSPFLKVGIASLSLDGSIESPGTTIGLVQTATSLARMLAPAVAGLAQSYSDDGPALLGAFGGIVATFCAFWFMSVQDEREGNERLKLIDY